MLMRIYKQTSTNKGSKVIHTASKVVMNHKFTSSVSAAVVVASSVLVTSHIGSAKTHLQQTSGDAQTSQTDPESTDKNLLTVSVNIPFNDNSDQDGSTRIDVTPSSNTNANVNVNGQNLDTDDNGGVHQTIPSDNSDSLIQFNVDSHTGSSSNSKNNTSSTLRIRSSTSTSSHDSSSQTTQINGRTIK